MVALYLKKVDIQGFKSFADKTEIEFKNEVTAIVGPNGSGKSNISDAIRWVLGEQSVKNLRGSKMEDIIFSGTDNRRALGYAEVTITFNNESGRIPIEYSEVAVTRRMFRSGESEYYLNKNSCRLKDVRELFMDSGIGKDGYSIIGQGKIDEILSNRPEDRRNIFEEAAGIIKFKTKKEEAERKLERTEGNIVRIRDLISEVLNQKNVLESEAEKATKFTKLYARLRDLEVNLFIRDIKKLEKQIAEIETEKEKINSDLVIIDEERNQIEEKYNVLKSNIESIEKEVEETRTIKFDTIQTYESDKSKISILLEKESFLNKDLERLKKEKIEVEESLEQLESSKINMNFEIEKINTELSEQQINFDLKTSELVEMDKLLHKEEGLLEDEKNSVITLYNHLSDKRSEINSINAFNENIFKRITHLKIEIEEADESISNLTKKEADLNEIQDINKYRLKGEKENIGLLNNKKLNLGNRLGEINECIKAHQIKANGLSSSFNLYKNMEAGYEGYYKSVKGIIQETKKDAQFSKGLIGIVADLLKVDSLYARAIEISLGSSAQNIVVETERDAKKFVGYLKEKGLGRATFLPIDVIKGKTLMLNSKEKEEFGILGLAHELIDFDEKYSNIFEYLLGRTIIVSDMDSGIRLANKQGHIYRIVTIDGEILNAGGSITGGSYSKESISIISRKNKIEDLQKEIEIINKDIKNEEEERISVEKSLESNLYEIINYENIIKEIDLKIMDTANKLNGNTLEIQRLKNEILRKNSDIDTLLSEQDTFASNKIDLEKSLIDIDKEIENAKINIDLKACNLVELKNQRDFLSKELTDIRISINSIENSKNIFENSTINYITTKNQLNDSNIEKKNTIQSILYELESSNISRSNIELGIKKHEASENEITLKLNELLRNKENYMKTFYDQQDRLKIINKRISEIEKQNNSLEIKLTRYELQYENTHNKLHDDYELNLEEALKFERELENIQRAQSAVIQLKEEIKILGNVNISAINDFRSVNERFEFISKQHLDLINAKENLNEVIRDMEKKMRSQFVESFKIINENFSEVFSVLFNGGKARLELEDNENILKSGIEIKVQPPGKKLQSLSLLSGGEKSLTAVALLFAILKTKPAPFCILDEIDAALDEANINRYTNYLKSFNKTTQFVLITHRKTTMEIADVLYGVTMEEEGISKLISIKLKDNLVEAS